MAGPTQTNQKAVVRHLSHVEDSVVERQIHGAKETVAFLRQISQFLNGHSQSATNISIKFDGSVSLIAGKDPADGKFFVGTKGVFSKTPKLAKNKADLQTLYGERPGLHTTMSVFFDALKGMSWPRILQGDVLFEPSNKRKANIDGETHLVFKPNTIIYAVPQQSPLGQHIDRATCGIAFHTYYSGTSLDNLQARSGVDVTKLNPPPDVVLFSAQFQNLSGTITFTQTEQAKIDRLQLQLQQQTTRLSGNAFLKLLANIPVLQQEFQIFQNALVRKGHPITLTPQTFGKQFILYLGQKAITLAQQRRTQSGMDAISERYTEMAKAVTANSIAVNEVIAWQKTVVDIKLVLLKKLNALTDLKTFYQTDDGQVAGGHEGFVAADASGSMVKLVDRSSFSMANFNKRPTVAV